MRKFLAILPVLAVTAGLSISHAGAKATQQRSDRRVLVWKAPKRVGANLIHICQQTKSGRHCFEISRRADLRKHLWRNSVVERPGKPLTRHADRHRPASR
jgi:hypothetical protein